MIQVRILPVEPYSRLGLYPGRLRLGRGIILSCILEVKGFAITFVCIDKIIFFRQWSELRVCPIELP